MSTLLEILRPDFLLHDALVASVLVGLVCPLVGTYFVLRRMIFLGVALPQLSACGIACAFLAYRMLVGSHEHGELTERELAMLGSFVFTLGGLLILAALERRGRALVEARIGITYAVAAAVTVLLLASDPHGDAQMVNLLKGDILATTASSLQVVTVVLSTVAAILFAFRKELLLVSFDRELALVFGKRVWAWDGLLYLVIGVTISLGVTTAGPIVTFGLLVLPPLTARLLTRRMASFAVVASVLGGTSAFVGFWVAYGVDLPLGPTQVAVASALLLVVTIGTRLRALVSPTGHALVRALIILLPLGLWSCATPTPAPPRDLHALAIAPVVNRTGDTLLVTGTSLLERYATRAAPVTVADIVDAELRAQCAEHGLTIIPSGTEAAPRLQVTIDRWSADGGSHPAFVIVALDARLVDAAGDATLWHHHRRAAPIATPGAATLGVAFETAARAAVAELLSSWPR